MMLFFRFVLFTLLLCMSISQVDAKHIIVSYDISGSMHKVDGQRRMYERDLSRLNNYLIEILFRGVPQSVPSRDGIVLSFDSGALYQRGDVLSYFRFETDIYEDIKREENVQEEDLRRKLPETMDYAGYQGQNTEFSKARAYVYEDLYREQDAQTYWILISDEDEDLSLGAVKDTDLKRKLAQFDRTYWQPPVFELLVNKHVTLRIRQIFRHEQLPQSSDVVYIATSQNPNRPAQIVAFSKDAKTGNFHSENLRLDTNNTEKGEFQLDRVESEIVSGDGQSIHNLETVSLNGISPPQTFLLTLPQPFSDETNSSNQLKLTIHYKHKESPQERSYSLSYTPIIDTLYLALADQPNQPISKIDFGTEDNFYINKDSLVLHTDNSAPSKFQISDVAFAVTTRGGRELYTQDIPIDPAALPASLPSFSISKDTPQFQDRTNQITLTVNYKYEGSQRKLPIIVNYNVHSPPSPLPFVIAGLVAGVVVLALLGRWIYGMISGGRSLTITLMEMTSTGGGASDTFTLEKEHIVSFRPPDSGALEKNQHLFNANCGGYLTFDGKNLSLHDFSEDGEISSVLSDGDEFSLKSAAGDFFVQIQVEFSDGTTDTPVGGQSEIDSEDDPIGGGSTAADEDDPLLR